jgi:hypothetical protein
MEEFGSFGIVTQNGSLRDKALIEFMDNNH